MPKPITCQSRNARDFCLERAGWTEDTMIHWTGNDECWKFLCKKVLDDLDVWVKSEEEPQFFSEKLDWMWRHGANATYGTKMVAVAGFWLYKNRIFVEADDLDYTPQERSLLIKEEFDKERKQFEKLQAKFFGIPNDSLSRSKIPSHVRIFVWQRDGGRCVECGSNENLEYDHIIPFTKGGSNTERNLQLLCGNCNRQKSDNIQ